MRKVPLAHRHHRYLRQIVQISRLAFTFMPRSG